MTVQEKIQKKAEGFGKLAPVFLEDAEFALENQCINYREQKPPLGVEVIAFNRKWIDEDFNPNGTRIGFLNENDDFTSVYWWDEQDCYEINDGNFYKSPIDNIEPEFWAYIPKFPKPQDKKNDYAR